MQSRREPHEKIKGWGNTYESMVATVCRPSRPYTFNGWPLWLLGSGTVAKEMHKINYPGSQQVGWGFYSVFCLRIDPTGGVPEITVGHDSFGGHHVKAFG